ncbi:GMC oxidoreductase [Streptomyces sp. NBC_01236]|uniref:GMC oxidoreductase n=1 Tax=Streptomyces sp. NBC_01236 TaxID=2903789 RepID=UPI002E108CDF|nr:GMC oxidoreductase [Streptomyces sp. NBC_01236]
MRCNPHRGAIPAQVTRCTRKITKKDEAGSLLARAPDPRDRHWMRFPTQRCPQRAFLAQAAGSNFHPAGSCAMGIGSDPVAAPDLTVDGIEGLRVVDASVLSTVVSVNTNTAAIMIAGKGADLIRGA